MYFFTRCGIVALCMALNANNILCNTDELMAYAIKNNFTKFGEIFDSEKAIYLLIIR